MSIYLGESGHVELLRDSLNAPLHSDLDAADVNVQRRRFSFDFPDGALITGDKIEIRTLDGNNLELVANHEYPDWDGYVSVDDAGGISLFATLEDALNDSRTDSLVLIAPSYTQQIVVKSNDIRYRCLANVSSFEITTDRETIDITSIGEQFRTQYAGGLISGQGNLNCFWAYKPSTCEQGTQVEFPQYLAQLCIRTVQGASFIGRFYLDTSVKDKYVWYEARCIITNVAMSFSSGDVVTSGIAFVTTGPIQLHLGMPPAYLLQENGDLILKEDGTGILIEET